MQFFCRKTGNSWPFFRVSRANWAHICVFGHEDSFDCPVWGGRGLQRTWIRILARPGQTLACNRRYARLTGTRWDASGKIGKTATNRSGSVSWAVLVLAARRGRALLVVWRGILEETYEKMDATRRGRHERSGPRQGGRPTTRGRPMTRGRHPTLREQP